MADLYQKIPQECLPPQNSEPNSKSYIENLLRRELSTNDARTIDRGLQYNFFLDRHRAEKKPKNARKRKFLTRKQRNQLGILKLPKDNWSYESLAPIRGMWKQYMRENLDLIKKAPDCSDQDWNSFSTIMSRSELVGSEIRIVRSKVPSQVGIEGTIVWETKMTFQIVTPKSKLKIISKVTSVFEFLLDGLKFTVFGKHLMTRPSERSVKKIKSHMSPDL